MASLLRWEVAGSSPVISTAVEEQRFVMWRTKDGVQVATPGFTARVKVPSAPSVHDAAARLALV